METREREKEESKGKGRSARGEKTEDKPSRPWEEMWRTSAVALALVSGGADLRRRDSVVITVLCAARSHLASLTFAVREVEETKPLGR